MLCQVEEVPSYSYVSESFYCEWVMKFFCIDYIHVIFLLYHINMVDYIGLFLHIKSALPLWNNPNLAMVCVILFIDCWIVFANRLLRIFFTYIHMRY